VKIVQTTAQAMGEMYGKLFVEVFGVWHPHRVPDIVYLFVDDSETDVIGFASGVVVKPGEIYLQYGGERKIYRGFKSKKRLREIRDHIHSRGFKYITTIVEASNNQMLRLYLSIGYVIFGTRIATDKTVCVELLSEKV